MSIEVYIQSADPHYETLIAGALTHFDAQRVNSPSDEAVRVILDFPLLWAFGQLEELNSLQVRRTIVVTQNTHALYRDALSTYHVSGIVMSHEPNAILSAIYSAADGVRGRRSGLHTPATLRVVRGLLAGLSTNEIAEIEDIKPRTVNSQIALCIQAMNVTSRTELVTRILLPNGSLTPGAS